MRKKVVAVFGTRPEAIKMAPVVIELKKRSDLFDVDVCATGQHKDMLYQALKIFNLEPDYDLKVMTQNQTLSELTATIIERFTAFISEHKPDLILVHGDTTTSFACGLVGFYTGTMVGHVEAGLRTFDLQAPFPEEFNRRATAMLSTLHFSPTEGAKQNLLDENIEAKKIFVTGNTIVDSLKMIESTFFSRPEIVQPFTEKYQQLLASPRFALVTTHRRENFGGGLESICDSIADLARKHPQLMFVLPVHLNPRVREIVFKRLAVDEIKKQVQLIEPVDYFELLFLLKNCSFVLTDSGGLQEEAPSFEKYVFVLREKTERPEACLAGLAELVGTDRELIVGRVGSFLANRFMDYQKESKENPYGDGKASEKIADIIQGTFSR